ncbi:hypothetical protein [Naumannella halotolerans]|uniref:hypothetical protein n=1 Tax=Naumannella halotolerans TaxID=993414 RepID=UPI0010608F67|nr:hypothetical protein [Naumannella halotolerans]
MIATTIDPRDQTSEFDAPTYRVFFWEGNGGCACEEWELSEADLDEVLEWIPAHSHGRPHSLWAVVRGGRDEVTQIRLRGIDPPAGPDTWPVWAKEERC